MTESAVVFENSNRAVVAERHPPDAAAYLDTIGWGENYPADWLVIGSKEQHALDIVQPGGSFRGVAQSANESNFLKVYYHAALGKQELAESRDVDVQDLGEDAQRLLVLNKIFGPEWAKKEPLLMRGSIGRLLEVLAVMDEGVGRNARVYPSAWKLSPDTLRRKIEIYDRNLGPGWRVNANLLTVSPRTVLSSARALPYIGVTPAKAGSTFYSLLPTTLSTKQQKVIHIRRSILDHTQIRHSSQKRRISTLGARKARQTEEDRQTELEELAELKRFIRHVGAKCLGASTKTIDVMAHEAGYI
ncbi:MAG TPA: hypothetical protein VIJ68_03640 [Candidatus Saccharimonadales bacterium]